MDAEWFPFCCFGGGHCHQEGRQEALYPEDCQSAVTSEGNDFRANHFETAESRRCSSPAHGGSVVSPAEKVLEDRAAGTHESSSYAGSFLHGDTRQAGGEAAVPFPASSQRSFQGKATDWRSVRCGPQLGRSGNGMSTSVARRKVGCGRLASRERRHSSPASQESGNAEGDTCARRGESFHEGMKYEEAVGDPQTRFSRSDNSGGATCSDFPEDSGDRGEGPAREGNICSFDKREVNAADQERRSSSSWLLQEERAAQRRVEHAVRLAMLRVIQLSTERQWHLPPPSPASPRGSCMYR